MKWSIRARKIRLKNSELRRAIGWCLQSLGHTQCMIDLPILSSNIWLWVKTLVLHWYPGYCTQMIRWLWDRSSKYGNTLWLFNIAMGNYLFIDGLPIKNGDFPWRTVSHNQMVGFDMFWPIPFIHVPVQDAYEWVDSLLSCVVISGCCEMMELFCSNHGGFDLFTM